MELNDIKESLRIFTNPLPFYNKLKCELEILNFDFFISVYERLGLSLNEIDFKFKNVRKKEELHDAVNEIQEKFKEILRFSPNLENLKKQNRDLLSNDLENLLIKESSTHRRIEWLLDSYNEDLELICKKRLMILTEKAGQGKTNLISDFVDNYIIPNKLLALFITGNQLITNSTTSFEDIISNELNPFNAKLEIKEILSDIEDICKRENCNFTIFIDGINEANNLEEFSEALYLFTEGILDYPFIKLVFTCRSEFYKERFPKFNNSPSFQNELIFKNDYMERYHRFNGPPEYFLEKLVPAYFAFFEVENIVAEKVQKEIASDFLLLRVFSEVFGKKVNPEVDKTIPIYDLYKDDLFKEYFEQKVQNIGLSSYEERLSYTKLIKSVLTYICSNFTFVNIPYSAIEDCDLEYLNKLTNEDIIFRTDIVLDEKSVLNNECVINFTFDEFRDYLIVDFILSERDFDIPLFLTKLGVNEYDVRNVYAQRNVTLEGILKYLFFKSRREAYREKTSFFEELNIYKVVFAQNIFSVNEDYISENDILFVKNLISNNDDEKEELFWGLFQRANSNVYHKLNIKLLINVIFELSENKYAEVINEYFKATLAYDHYHRDKTKGYIHTVTNKIAEKFTQTEVDFTLRTNLIEFLVSLSAVDGNGYGKTSYQLETLVEEYLNKYPVSGQEMLFKYYNTKNLALCGKTWEFILFMYDEGVLNFGELPYNDILELFFDEKKKQIHDLMKPIVIEIYENQADLFSKEQSEIMESNISSKKFKQDIDISHLSKEEMDEIIRRFGI